MKSLINSKNIIFATGFVLLIFAYPFFSWLCMAAVVAFALKPLQRKWLQKKLKLSKTLSVYLLLSLIVLASAPFILSFLSFMNESSTLIEHIKDQNKFKSLNSFISFLYENFDFLTSFLSQEQAKDLARQALGGLAKPGLNFAKNFFSSLPSFFIGLFFFAAGLFYFMADSDEIKSFFKKVEIIPKTELNTWIDIIQKASQSTLYAAFLTGVVQSTLISLTALICGSNYFFTTFFITFFLSQVPLIGTAPVSVGLIIYFYSSGSNTSALIIFIAGLLAGFSDNVVRAWVMSHYDSLHPLAGLVTAIGGLLILGPVGVFLGPVLAMVFVKALNSDKLFV
jgi:predicted PurR-regulated permease PerM